MRTFWLQSSDSHPEGQSNQYGHTTRCRLRAREHCAFSSRQSRYRPALVRARCIVLCNVTVETTRYTGPERRCYPPRSIQHIHYRTAACTWAHASIITADFRNFFQMEPSSLQVLKNVFKYPMVIYGSKEHCAQQQRWGPGVAQQQRWGPGVISLHYSCNWPRAAKPYFIAKQLAPLS